MAEENMSPEGSDLDDKIRAIAEADVLVVGFDCLAERLLIDARRNDGAGPYVRIVQPVRSPQERLRQLRELRPGFNDPESFVFIPATARVRRFADDGHFERILARCSGDPEAEDDCRKAREELLKLDLDDLRQALVGGDRYHTKYERGSD